jgi:hypothetical protein
VARSRLDVYLNDHRAGAVLGTALARRALRSNQGTELGRFLAGLVVEIEADRRSLEQVMSRTGTPRSRVKPALASAAEKVARLKLNGQLTGYSPLSRLLELEGLTVGIAGKRALWQSLAGVAEGDERLAEIDFAALVERAEAQLDGLERQRRDAAARAFEVR